MMLRSVNNTPPRSRLHAIVSNGMGRALLLIGLTALVLAVMALLWGRWVPVGPAESVDRPPGAGISSGEQPPESTPNGSTGATDGVSALWTQVDESTMAALPPYADDWSAQGRVLVEVSDLDRLWGTQVGDRLGLPVPQLRTTYQAVVDEIDEGAGARALVGTIAGSDGYRRRSVVTIGPASLFAFIDTPNGTYEFAIDLGRHRHGWLVPSSSMQARWDFSKPDYFIDRDRNAGRDLAP